MQSWQNSLRAKIKLWRLRHYGLRRRGHLAAKNELRERAKADLTRPKDCLRDERLKPQLLPASWLNTVGDVRQGRRLYGARQVSVDLDAVIAGGRLIAYSPEANLACGTSEFETKGYLDENNAPPWDTWVALLDAPNAKHWESSLIARVPPMFVPLVQAGIDVIPEYCVLWLEDCPTSLKQLWNEVVSTEQEEPRLKLK